ncbi:MAG: AraC family transcriptional regulator [Phormidesmis sp.]
MATHAFVSVAEALFELPRPPLLCSSEAEWNTIQLALFKQPPHRIPEHVSPYHVICINAGASVTLEQTIGGKSYLEGSVPGDIGIYPAHLCQTFEWHQEAKFLQLYLEPAVLNQISLKLYGRETAELLAQPIPPDPVIGQIAATLQRTLSDQAAGSRLYADAMSNALATHLVYHYCAHNKPKPTDFSGRLSQSQLKRVTEYIDEHLAQNLSLAELANVVSLSPFHFARLFKSSVGVAPHQYHIRCRVNCAKQLLLKRELSLAQIAYAVGFASQSHLNYHFKRAVGLTPTAFLKQ